MTYATDMLVAQGSRPFGRTVPALIAFRDAPVAFSRLDARLANQLRAAGIATWADVAGLSPDTVRSWRGAGPRTVACLAATIVAALADPYGHMGVTTPPPPRPPIAAPRSLSADAVTTLVDAVVRAGITAHRERNRAIFARLIDAAPQRPLRHVATDVGITDHNVDALFAMVRSRLRQELDTAHGHALRARAHELRGALGAIAFAHGGATHDAIATACRGLSGDRAMVASVLLHLAGPYRRRDDVWLCSPGTTFGKVRTATKTRFAHAGLVPGPIVDEHLHALGIASGALPDLRARLPLRLFGDRVLWWDITLGDKAIALLMARGEPSTAFEIWATLAEGSTPRLITDRLQQDERATRLPDDRWALTAWDMPPTHGDAPGTRVT